VPIDPFTTLKKDHRKMIALLAQMISLSDRAQAVAALAEFRDLFESHEHVESRALYPLLGDTPLPKDVALAHAAVRQALRHLSQLAPDEPAWWDGVVRLRQVVEQHIVEEEGVLVAVGRDRVAAHRSPGWVRSRIERDLRPGS
jgi:hypothetical protein